MILDSKLNFRNHIREAIIKARRGIGIIRNLCKYVSRDVLGQIYKLYMRPISFITNITQSCNFTLPNVGIHPILRSANGDWIQGVELTQTSFTKNSAGKSFIIEGGIDPCVTFTNCGMIRDRITYILK